MEGRARPGDRVRGERILSPAGTPWTTARGRPRGRPLRVARRDGLRVRPGPAATRGLLALAAALVVAACAGPADRVARLQDAPPAPPPAPERPTTAPDAGARPTAASEDDARLVLRWAVSETGPFTALELEPGWGGVNVGQARGRGWQAFDALDGPIRVAPDAPAEMALGAIRPGESDRVFAAAEEAFGLTADGRRVRLENHIEPIVHPLSLAPGEQAVVEVGLVVLPHPYEPGQHRIFVRDARRLRADS